MHKKETKLGQNDDSRVRILAQTSAPSARRLSTPEYVVFPIESPGALLVAVDAPKDRTFTC